MNSSNEATLPASRHHTDYTLVEDNTDMIKLRPARLSINTVLTMVLLVVLVISEKMMDPVHRGFFCDDHSIMKPYITKQTVPVPILIGVTAACTFVVVFSTEVLTRKTNREVTFKDREAGYVYVGNIRLLPWVYRVLSHFCFLIIGMTMSTLFTNVGKKFVGRLRPHFLAVCRPDYKKFNCSDGYITADVCTTNDLSALRQARLSFPSGHSSIAMFTSVVLILYVEYRVQTPRFSMVKPFVQFTLLVIGMCCCYTRISDYWHHWSDVVVGIVIGVVFAVYTVVHLMRLNCVRDGVRDDGYIEIRAGRERSRLNSSDDVEGRTRVASYGGEMVN